MYKLPKVRQSSLSLHTCDCSNMTRMETEKYIKDLNKDGAEVSMYPIRACMLKTTPRFMLKAVEGEAFGSLMMSWKRDPCGGINGFAGKEQRLELAASPVSPVLSSFMLKCSRGPSHHMTSRC